MAEPPEGPPAQNEEIDNDSAIGEDRTPSTHSLSSSICDYRLENGRTYHRYKDGKYLLPNDEAEQERLGLFCPCKSNVYFRLTNSRCATPFVLPYLNDKLGLAPPNDPNSKAYRVLDLGTGTGLWAIEYADEHPEADVIGVDLSPIQPNFVPPNVQFQIDDIEEEWTYKYPFDYIHGRLVTSSITNLRGYLRQIYENLNAGGYVELQEADLLAKSDDGTLTEDHALSKWLQYLGDASVRHGRPHRDITKLKAIMTEIGFVDIEETRKKWPTNPWPQEQRYKNLGLWSLKNMGDGLEAFSMAPLTRILHWTKDEVTVFLVGVRKDLEDNAIHAYWPVYSIYAKKPEP